MKEQTKRVLQAVHLEAVAIKLWQAYRGTMRKCAPPDKNLIDKYLRERSIRKLHVGCGGRILDGWLNSDFAPGSPVVLDLDATKRFPFGNDEFDYIFSEHMIEHVSYCQGRNMLDECYRVLRKGGKVRISTPNLTFLMDLYQGKASELHDAYIKWMTARYIPWAPCSSAAFVVNLFVREWGHQFIYDEETLSLSLKKAGFTNVTRCRLQESDVEAFRNLEFETRMPEGLLRLETITLEATKLPVDPK